MIMDNRKTFNIGVVQGGAVAIDGDATNSGTSNIYNQKTLEIIQSHLNEAEEAIKTCPIDSIADKKAALEAIAAARAAPTKDNLSRAVSAMDKVEALAFRALGAATGIALIIEQLGRAAGLH